MSITKDIQQAAENLLKGNIVAIPTETVYGLAALASHDDAVKEVFSLKQRPLTHPLIMHVSKTDDVNQYAAFIPDYAHLLMEKFWPGPLTLVFKSRPGQVNPLVTGGQDTVAIRCPAHPITEALLKAVNAPLVAPSANPFGKISPTTAEHVQQSFNATDLMILEGGRCPLGIESTIVDASNPAGYQILRQGSLSETRLLDMLPGAKSALSHTDMRVPGRLHSHYQPVKPLYCFEKDTDLLHFCQTNEAVYLLSFEIYSDLNLYNKYQLPGTPEALAYELYYQLRLADASKARTIVMKLPPDTPDWQGVRERILKASFRET